MQDDATGEVASARPWLGLTKDSRKQVGKSPPNEPAFQSVQRFSHNVKATDVSPSHLSLEMDEATHCVRCCHQ